MRAFVASGTIRVTAPSLHVHKPHIQRMMLPRLTHHPWGDTMRTRTIAAALAATALLTLTACEGTDSSSSSKPDTTAEETNDQAKDVDATATDTETSDSAADTAAESATLPDLVGQDLQAAQDEAQAAGFYVLDDQDASGQNRLQVLDRNWVVCSQEPAAGTHPTDTPVVLYAVKDDETC